MKREVTIEQHFCDVCDKETSSHNACDHCGKDFCYDCGSAELIEYKHAVHFSGSGDGHYCRACDVELTKSRNLKHAAYRKIAALRNEQAGWYEDFKARAVKAEEELKKFQ